MTDNAPRFSIVIPHYDGTISDELLLRGLHSLTMQTFRDFEILLYHDGPLSRPLPDLNWVGPRLKAVRVSEQRFNDWGHSLRDQGIRDGRGDYIVHFNPDNILYPRALATLDAAARAPVRPAPVALQTENPEVLIFAILMRGMQCSGKVGPWRNRNDTDSYLIYTGMPPILGAIDCMQVVMRRSLWLSIGGWYDRSEVSDGIIYSKLIKERGARYVSEVLGEHW
jgi:Glycosyl transferase family 2